MVWEVEDDSGGKEAASEKVGWSHESIHNHSWKPIGPDWVWISKLSAAQGFGFPATKREVQRFGHLARRVKRLGSPPPLLHSFAQAMRESGMAGRDPEQRPWKR